MPNPDTIPLEFALPAAIILTGIYIAAAWWGSR